MTWTLELEQVLVLLSNETGRDAASLMDTAKVPVGSVLGSRNWMRRLVPKIFFTLTAVVVATGVPPQVAATVIITFAGSMVPVGKPEPVTLT